MRTPTTQSHAFRHTRIVALAAACLVCIRCGGDSNGPIVTFGLALDPSQATKAVGETQSYTASGGGVLASTVTFTSSSSVVALHDEAVIGGQAIIFATRESLGSSTITATG